MRLAFAALVASLVVSVTPARANASLDITPAFKGTIVSTFPDGRTTKLWLAKDGSYRATSRDGKLSDGTWKIKDERMCMRQQHPFFAPWDYCTDLPTRLDTSWRGKSATGLPVTIALVRHR